MWTAGRFCPGSGSVDGYMRSMALTVKDQRVYGVPYHPVFYDTYAKKILDDVDIMILNNTTENTKGMWHEDQLLVSKYSLLIKSNIELTILL